MSNPSSTKSFIHYDPERVDYSLSKDELENIKNIGQNNWKDFSIACLGVGIPCLINGISEIRSQEAFRVTISMNLNLIIGGIGIILGIAFLIAWQKSKKSMNEIIEQIKNKPRIEFAPQITNVGEIKDKSS